MEVDSNEVINLIKMNDTAYVWSSQDWLRLRSLRIVGNLIGNLATLTKQDRIAGLPLALLKEETTLLLEKGYATLKAFPYITDPPNEELRKKSKAQREKFFTEQTEVLRNERKLEIASNIDAIMEGKKAKKRNTAKFEENSEPPKREDVLQEEFKKIEFSNESALTVQLCTRDPWIQETDAVNCFWEHPEEKKVHYLVFKDLWEKGYYITLGGKFGGDYLVYPGDPIKFHAMFIVIILEKTKKLQMQDIVTYGRLGHSVRKTVVLTFLNDFNEITYHSVQWDGF